MLKIFIDEGKLIINCEDTLEQLYTFTKRKTGNKFEAEDGYFDDMVMGIAVLFAPFMEIKVFDDFELFTRQLHKVDSTQKAKEYLSVIDFGISDDGSEPDAFQNAIDDITELGLWDEFQNTDYGIAVSHA